MSQPLFDPSPHITDRQNVVMAAGTDVEAVDEPIKNGDVKSHSTPAQSTHTSMSHYLGLPYQDHNYGQPPPPTPPQSPPPTLDSVSILPLPALLENPTNPPSFTPPEDNTDALKDEGVTRCICNFDHDDGYMICCDKCLVWQHVDCMGLERDNIPELYFCERCEPRIVDQEKALELQTIKRQLILERIDSSDDENKPKSRKKRYSSISNTPTSLTLTSTKGKNKMKKKKKKKEKEKAKEKVKEEEKDSRQEKHHKKKKKKKFDLSLSPQRKHRKNRGRSEPAIGDLLLHGEQILDSADNFVEATENQYSMELNQFLIDQRQNAMWTMPSLGCIMDDLSPQKIRLGSAGRTARGLVATEELAPNQPIVEYRGMLMLRDQFVPTNGWTKKPYLHVLMYSKFSNIELCVDARKYGNIARYVRKSCSPNAEVRHVAIDGLLRLYLFSLVEIAKGTEVTVGFDFSYKDCSHPVKCACAKKNCPVKRYWRKRRALEARNQKKPGMDWQVSSPAKRTVSPLRVSLTAANTAENRVEQVTRSNDPPKPIQEEISFATINTLPPKRVKSPVAEPTKEATDLSDSEHKEKVDVVAVDSTPQITEQTNKENETAVTSDTPKEEEAQPKKMTREERKMEAIMKAFAKMEKAQERRQQALERISHNKPLESGEEQGDKDEGSGPGQHGQQEQEEQHQQKQQEPHQLSSTTTSNESGQLGRSESGMEEQSKSSEATTKDESSSNTAAPAATPTTRKPSRKRRRNTMNSSRRRIRSNSIASAASQSTSVEVSSADDDSNQAPLGGLEKTTYSTTPLSVLTNSYDKVDAPLASPGSSSSKRFRFPKTKKFFMNEWLNEKAFESLASKPLTIKTDQLDCSYSSNLSSPNTPLLQRSGSLSALTKDVRSSNSLESSCGLGSAKKRWLRQAMSEGSSNNNQDSSTCNGTLSPIASPALSPNTSASSDMMTPLKKRLLRHSLAEEAPLGGSSPKYEHKTSQGPATPVAATPINNNNLDASPSEEPPILIQAKADLEPVQEEDVRKNSSIDSGLSVTTPADLEKSPIAIKAGLEERLQEFTGEESTLQGIKEKPTDLDVKSTGVSDDHSKDSSATLVAGDNNNLIKEELLKEKDQSDGIKREMEITGSEKEENVKDQTDGIVNTEVEERTQSPVIDKSLESSKAVECVAAASPEVAAAEKTSVDESKSCETTQNKLSDESGSDGQVTKTEDLQNRSLPSAIKSEHLDSLYVNSLRTRHASIPGTMQGQRSESGPLTLTTSFADDNNVSSSNLYTPFSPKKRLLRQNTDPTEHRDHGPSMASSWPQTAFTSPQRIVGPREEVQGPNQPGNSSQKDAGGPTIQGATTSPAISQVSPDRLSASWGTGARSGISGQGAPPRTMEPGTTPSPSPSPGPQIPNAPPQGILKPGTPPLAAARNLGSSLSAAAGSGPESGETDTSQAANGVTTSTVTSTTSSGESSASNSAQSTPVKKKVSLLEYRKRKGSSAKPASSSSSSSSSATTTTAVSSTSSLTASLVGSTTTGSTKLPLITLPDIPLPDIPAADPLKDEPNSKKPSKTPTKTSSTSSPSTSANPAPKPPTGKLNGSPRKGESGSGGKPGSKPSSAGQSGFAIFSTKTKDGQTPTLTLTSEAQQVINSITSLLMEESHVHNGDIKDRSLRRSESVHGESRYARRNYQDKPWEKDGRGDAVGSLKRPLSPEPPPPPPGKKVCTGIVPPPPPPKGAVSRDARQGENGPSTPLRQNSAPGAAVTVPVVTNSPLKNVTGNTIVPAQYGIAHRNQNQQQFPVQYTQQPQPQQQQQFAPNAYHPRPAQPLQTQQPQSSQTPQVAITQQQQQQPPRPVPPPQKHGSFNYPAYSAQPTEKTNAQGFSQQHRPGYPAMPYRQNQTQHGNHFGVQNKFSTNGRKSPYGSQDSTRQHTYYGRSNSSTYPARKNFQSQ